MKLIEMIEVMQHFENGGEVECSSKGKGLWNTLLNSNHYWNWQTMDYRIKEPKQKITIEKWLCQNDKGIFITIETSNIDEYVYYKKVKLIKSYVVEL